MKRAIGALSKAVVILAFAFLFSSQTPWPAEPPERLEIFATAIDGFDPGDAARTRFGALEFRGGLVLTSRHPRFGGLSALRIGTDGAHFLALNDRGFWLRGRIVYDGARRPSGIADADIAPMLGEDGQPLHTRWRWYDSESLAIDGEDAYVGIERVHRIVRFPYARHGLLARGTAIAVPPDFRKLPANQGIECLVAPDKGMPLAGVLIAISERGLDANGNILGFLVGGKETGRFSVKRSDDFNVTDCAVTPDADLILLERRFSWRRGVAMRMRRMALSQVADGRTLDGEVLIEADFGYQIDNMEGLSAHRDALGKTVLTLVSDDNFSPLQRTLLLQFTLVE